MSPYKSKHPCNHPGCPELTFNRFCQKHEKLNKKISDEKRGSASERGYNGTWARVRIMKLNEAPLCERCKMAAILVHHRDRNPRNNLWENLESLCLKCHDGEHKKERWGGVIKSSGVSAG